MVRKPNASTGFPVLGARHLVVHGSSLGSYTGWSQNHASYPEYCPVSYLVWYLVSGPRIWMSVWRKQCWVGGQQKTYPWS